MDRKAMIAIFILVIIVLAGITIYFSSAKSEKFTDQNAQMKKKLDVIRLMLEDTEQSRIKAKKASIKSYMISMIDCSRNNL